jgi:hypothetical protein
MKRIAWLMLGAGLAGTACGQGVVTMNSVQVGAYVRFSDVVTHAWVENAPGSQLGSLGWINVGLYWGYFPDPWYINNLAGPLATVGSGATAGMVLTSTGGGARSIVSGDGWPVTQPVYFQLRAWTGPFATYEQALASGDSRVDVSSTTGWFAAPVVMATPSLASGLPATIIPWGGTGVDPVVVMFGLHAPEPGVLALLGFGLIGLILVRHYRRVPS